MKIRGFIVGFNLFDNVSSDVTIEDEHRKGRKIKIDCNREEAEALHEKYGIDRMVTVTVGEGEDL